MHLVGLPLLVPFKTSLGVEKERKSLILEYHSRGIRAYSECVTFDDPFYSPEDNSTAIHIIRNYLAKLLKTEPTPEEFIAQTTQIRGHYMAKAAIEMLLWDFHCKLKNESIACALGDSRGYAEVGISLGMEDKRESLVKKVEAAVAKGYKRIKLKIERGKEYDLIKPVRDSYPNVPLSVDANGGYSLKDLDALKRLDRFNLLYVEQPLDYDDLQDHAKLAKQISTPICLDESITTPKRALQAFEIGAVKIVNIKPGRLGGLSNSLEVARIAKESGGRVWVGGMLETGVGRSFNVALASLKLVDLPGDTSPNDEYFARDIVKNPFGMKDGNITPNSGPGIGIELDNDFLSNSVRQSWTVF